MNEVNIGELDTKVTLQQIVQTIGAQGQKTRTTSTQTAVWAKVEHTVDESVGDSNVEAVQTIKLTIYKFSGLNTRWTVLVNSKPYEILSIDPISRMSPLCYLTLQAIDG